MPASFALALGQVISVHNAEDGMFNAQPQRPPLLGTKQQKSKHPHKNKSDLAETQAGMKT